MTPKTLGASQPSRECLAEFEARNLVPIGEAFVQKKPKFITTNGITKEILEFKKDRDILGNFF